HVYPPHLVSSIPPPFKPLVETPVRNAMIGPLASPPLSPSSSTLPATSNLPHPPPFSSPKAHRRRNPPRPKIPKRKSPSITKKMIACPPSSILTPPSISTSPDPLHNPPLIVAITA